MDTGTAFFKIEMKPIEGNAVQLLPAGSFKAIDGRPRDVPGNQFKLTRDAAEKVIAKAQQKKNDLFIDYEHQTLKSELNGQPAPAAGWIKPETLKYVEGKGLFADVKWTKKAQEHIDAGEYRYISSNIIYNKKNGEIISLFGAALVNHPAVDGMEPVTELKADSTAKKLYSPLCGLLNSLGVTVADNITPSHIEDAAKAMLKQQPNKNEPASDMEGLTTQLKAIQNQIKELQGFKEEADSLSALREKEVVERLIQDAQNDGRVIAREVEEYTSFGAEFGSERLKAFLDKRAPILALKGKQTDEIDPPEALKAKLNRSKVEQEVLSNCGYEQFSDEE